MPRQDNIEERIIAEAGFTLGRWRVAGEPIWVTKAQMKYQPGKFVTPEEWKARQAAKPTKPAKKKAVK